MAVPGLSTLGIRLGYGLETTAGTKPAAFTNLTRVNAIGGINTTPEVIDASALEDLVTKSIAGREDTGGEWPVTVNLTNETITEWETLISAYNDRTDKDLQMWWQVSHPDMTKAFFVVAAPPKNIPLPELGQNELQTAEMTLTINDYKGMDTKVG